MLVPISNFVEIKPNNVKKIKPKIEIENNQISQDEVKNKNVKEKTGWWS